VLRFDSVNHHFYFLDLHLSVKKGEMKDSKQEIILESPSKHNKSMEDDSQDQDGELLEQAMEKFQQQNDDLFDQDLDDEIILFDPQVLETNPKSPHLYTQQPTPNIMDGSSSSGSHSYDTNYSFWSSPYLQLTQNPSRIGTKPMLRDLQTQQQPQNEGELSSFEASQQQHQQHSMEKNSSSNHIVTSTTNVSPTSNSLFENFFLASKK
jgi:hypothetical protein